MSHPISFQRRLILSAIGAAFIGAAATAGAGPLDLISGGEGVKGNGTIKTQKRTPGAYTGISLQLPASVELKLGNVDEVLIETDDNLLPLIETVVENGVLKIRSVRNDVNFRTRTMKIVVQARDINRVIAAGSGEISARLLRGPKLQVDIEGSGEIKVDRIEADQLSVKVAGSGEFEASAGTVKSLAVSIGGSGDVEMAGVVAQTASVSVAGSGDATVSARDALSATIAGSGDITYYGDPKLSRTVVGSGQVDRGGPLR